MRTRLLPLLLLPPLALTACSSSGAPAALQATASPTPAASAAASPTATAGATAAPATGAATAAATAAPTRAAAPSAPAGAPAAPAPGARSTAVALRGTAPGTYTSDTSGTVTFGTGKQDASGTQTLTVSPLRGDTQHSKVHGDQGDTDEDLVVRSTGTYLAGLTLTSPAFTKAFRPAAPVLLVPDPATVGSSWSWTAVSTDGKTTARTTNRVERTETVTVGGTRVSTAVVVSHLVLSGDVSYTADLTTDWAPSLRLPVRTRTVGKGTYSGIAFSTDVTSLLRSLQPS